MSTDLHVLDICSPLHSTPFTFVSVHFYCIKWSDECKDLLLKPEAGTSLSLGLIAPRSLWKQFDSIILELSLLGLWLVDTGPEALFPHSCHNMMWSTLWSTLMCPSESAQTLKQGSAQPSLQCSTLAYVGHKLNTSHCHGRIAKPTMLWVVLVTGPHISQRR